MSFIILPPMVVTNKCAIEQCVIIFSTFVPFCNSIFCIETAY